MHMSFYMVMKVRLLLINFFKSFNIPYLSALLLMSSLSILQFKVILLSKFVINCFKFWMVRISTNYFIYHNMHLHMLYREYDDASLIVIFLMLSVT